MKRIYWLLIAAVPVVLWWLSQSGNPQDSKSSAPPQPNPEPAKPEAATEPAKDLPTSSNGTFPKPAAAAEPAPPVAVEPAPAAAVEAPPAPPEQIQQAAELAPPVVPQLETKPVVEEAAVAEADGELVQVFDSKDQPLECQLVEVTTHQALLRCPVELPEKEKVRLVLPFDDQAITVNAQLVGVDEGIAKFKIMTLKAGQKKRFEEYLAQRKP